MKLATAPPRREIRLGYGGAVDLFDNIGSHAVQKMQGDGLHAANFYRALGLPKKTPLLKDTAPLLESFRAGRPLPAPEAPCGPETGIPTHDMSLNLPLATALTLDAPTIFPMGEGGGSFIDWLSNSILVCALIALLILWFARKATKNMSVVPGPTQNFFEAVVQQLYDLIESVVGKHMVARVFPLLATLFIFIIVSNWFGLLPGVGSIGWGHESAHGFEVTAPLLRPATADLNLTLAMSAIFMVFWLYWSLAEVGLKNFLNHIFGVKGGLKGVMAALLAPIFIFVGLIEVVSIAFRPVSLSLRLFGNIFAGENLLTAMINLGKDLGLPVWISYIFSVTIPVPFYFLEILVGMLQALVFMLLCSVYIQLSTSHDEEEEGHH